MSRNPLLIDLVEHADLMAEVRLLRAHAARLEDDLTACRADNARLREANRAQDVALIAAAEALLHPHDSDCDLLRAGRL